MRRRLATHLRYIYTCDWLVEVEGGVKELEEGELEQVCDSTFCVCVCVCVCV